MHVQCNFSYIIMLVIPSVEIKPSINIDEINVWSSVKLHTNFKLKFDTIEKGLNVKISKNI